MSRSVRRALLACLLLPAAVLVPAAQATEEKVIASSDTYYYSHNGVSYTIFALCQAEAFPPTAAWTRVSCRVGPRNLDVRVPPQSPVGQNQLLWDFSDTQSSGPRAVAFWEGGGQPPFDVCTYGQAAYNQSGGGLLIVEHGPICRTIYG